MNGQSITCDPIVAQLLPVPGQPPVEMFENLKQSESTLLLANAAPGLKRVNVLVNGRRFRLADLQDRQTRVLNVSAGMQPGAKNTIVVEYHGRVGGSATLVISG